MIVSARNEKDTHNREPVVLASVILVRMASPRALRCSGVYAFFGQGALDKVTAFVVAGAGLKTPPLIVACFVFGVAELLAGRVEALLGRHFFETERNVFGRGDDSGHLDGVSGGSIRMGVKSVEK